MHSAVLLSQQGSLLARLASLSDSTAQLAACDRAGRELKVSLYCRRHLKCVRRRAPTCCWRVKEWDLHFVSRSQGLSSRSLGQKQPPGSAEEFHPQMPEEKHFQRDRLIPSRSQRLRLFGPPSTGCAHRRQWCGPGSPLIGHDKTWQEFGLRLGLPGRGRRH